MNYRFSSVLLLTLALTAGGVALTPAAASTVSSLIGPSVIENRTSGNALTIKQQSSVGKNRTSSGALMIDNSGNVHTGLTIYSNRGADVAQPLMRMEVTNPEWKEEVLYIKSDSPTSRGLIRLDSPAPEIEFVETDQSGAAGKFEIRVQHDTLQFNSRRADDTTFENKISMSHGGDLILEHGTVKVEGGAPAQFAGGINITGGCIAVDGKCITPEGSTSAAPAPSATAPTSGGAMSLSDGAPRALDCNSNTERGRQVLDYRNHRVYVCNGPERGWDYFALTN